MLPKSILDLFLLSQQATDFNAQLGERLCLAFNAERSAIFRLDDKGRTLRMEYGTDVDAAAIQDLTLRVGEGICGSAILSRKAVNVFDAQRSLLHDPRVGEATGYRANSVLAVPIQYNGYVYGALEVLNYLGDGRFPDSFEAPFMAVGCLYGARLFAARSGHGQNIEGITAKRLAKHSEPLLLGTSNLLLSALSTCLKAARTNDPVLIMGESGTGKELAARRIHQSSDRAAGKMVSVNCAALSETLLESELFGHVAGAFTGARKARKGMFAAASGGTLFLDEVGDMSPSCQAKTLRAIELGEILPVGADQPVCCDVRIIAASNKDLWKEAKAGRFREDLFFRLGGIEIELPPLRERKCDIPLLAEHFLVEALEPNPGRDHFRREISADIMSALTAYNWPGNVRELRQVIRSAAAMADDELRLDSFPQRIKALASGETANESRDESAGDAQYSIHDERERYLKVLRETAYPGSLRWNISAAARKLNIPRRSLAYRIDKLFKQNAGSANPGQEFSGRNSDHSRPSEFGAHGDLRSIGLENSTD